MLIKHKNIIYIRDFSKIGGVETFTFELIKKYHDLDIAVVYKTADEAQIERVEQYCPTYQHINQDIECEVAIINYDITIIPYITERIWKQNAKEGQGIYQAIHADYEHPAYEVKNPTDDRIKMYIGITKHIVESFKKATGNTNVMLGYNPLEIDKHPLMLVSMTRLSKVKGKDRMIKLAKALDDANIDYVWYVFTDNAKDINNPNIICKEPTLESYKWLAHSDYLVQLSDTEACSYSINEALYRNIPVIVTPLPYLKEIGVEHGKNAWIMEFDCSNINEIVKNITNVPKFEFKHLRDSYGEILCKSKSNYNIECEYTKVIAIETFKFGRFRRVKNLIRKNKDEKGWIYKGDIFDCPNDLLDYLLGNGNGLEPVVEVYNGK